MNEKFYIDKNGQILIKIGTYPLFENIYIFSFWYPNSNYNNYDFNDIENVTWYDINEVALIKDEDLVMYKLLGKI